MVDGVLFYLLLFILNEFFFQTVSLTFICLVKQRSPSSVHAKTHILLYTHTHARIQACAHTHTHMYAFMHVFMHYAYACICVHT